MRIAAFFMPIFALLAGAVGFYIRLLEVWNVFESYTGLPLRGMSETYTLMAVSAVFLILVLIFSIQVSAKHTARNGFENAFGTEPLTYPSSFVIIGIIWFGATVKHFLDVNATGVLPATELFFSIFSALSAVSVALFAIEMFQDPQRKSVFALSIIPTLFMCFWLIFLYRQNASNPVLLGYAYHCLAIIASALGFYFTSGFLFNKPAPGKTIFCYFAAIYFCFVTLADNHTLMIKIIISSILAMNVIYCSKLLRHLHRKELPINQNE